jgi:hypothetical protein
LFSLRSCSAAFIDVYRLVEGKLQLAHRTPVEDVPLCMIEFQGRLLVGIGRTLRLYDLGKKALLRKCENKHFPTCIVTLHAQVRQLEPGGRVAESDGDRDRDAIRDGSLAPGLRLTAIDLATRVGAEAIALALRFLDDARGFGARFRQRAFRTDAKVDEIEHAAKRDRRTRG